MRLKKSLSFLFLAISGILCAQTNNYQQYQQYLLAAQRSTSADSVVDYYKKAFNVAEPFAEDLKNLSNTYFYEGNLKEAEKTFYKSVEQGYQLEKDNDFESREFSIDYNLGYINLKDTTGYGLFLSQLYTTNKKKLIKLRKGYLKKKSGAQNEIYESMLQNEYYFQSLRFLFYDGKVKDTVAFPYIAKYGATPNSYYMLRLLKEKKFPDRRKCARFNGHSITMLLNHAIAGFLNKDDANVFVTLLWEEVPKGNITPYEYASAYDHYIQCFIDENKNLIGTTQYMDDNGRVMLMDLLDPAGVNAIRKKYWLDTIENYCENFNIKLPRNYE